MSNSSQQTDYITISNNASGYPSSDTITIIGGDSSGSYTMSSGNTITLNLNDITIDSYAANMSSITVPTVSTIDLSGIDSISNHASMDWYMNNTEWVDSFPDWYRMQEMCKKYPSLEIAMRNLQTIYTLVKDDYDNAKDQE